MRNAAAPSVGGDRMAPMPPADRMAPPISAGYPALRSSGHATDPSITVVATPLPETVPSRKPAIVTVRPGPAPLPDRPLSGHRPIQEKAPRAGKLQHSPVDREQHDVGGGDIERHAEDALQRHVERSDQPVERIAPMGKQTKADESSSGP